MQSAKYQPVAGGPHSFGLKWTMRLSKLAMGAVGAAPLSKAVVVPPGCSVARRSPVAWAARLAEPAREHLQFPYRRRWRSRSGPILPGIDVCRVPTRGSTDRCASAAVGLQGRKEDRVHAALDTRRHGMVGVPRLINSAVIVVCSPSAAGVTLSCQDQAIVGQSVIPTHQGKCRVRTPPRASLTPEKMALGDA